MPDGRCRANPSEARRGEAAAVQAARVGDDERARHAGQRQHGRGVRQPRGRERLRRMHAGGLAVVEADDGSLITAALLARVRAKSHASLAAEERGEPRTTWSGPCATVTLAP